MTQRASKKSSFSLRTKAKKGHKAWSSTTAATLLGFSCLIGASQHTLAEAPVARIGGAINNEILIRGMILNAGAAIGGMEGGNADLEVSVGTVHGNSEVNGDVNNNIQILGALGSIAIVNTGMSWQGKLCAKTSVGSIGASTCTYDGE